MAAPSWFIALCSSKHQSSLSNNYETAAVLGLPTNCLGSGLLHFLSAPRCQKWKSANRSA